MSDLHLSQNDLKKLFFGALLGSALCYVAGIATAIGFQPNFGSQLKRIDTKLANMQHLSEARPAGGQEQSHRFKAQNTPADSADVKKLTNPVSYERQPSPTRRFAVQAGVFQMQSNALALQANLRRLGIATQIISSEPSPDQRFRVILQQFENERDARKALKEFRVRYNMVLTLTPLKNASKPDSNKHLVAVITQPRRNHSRSTLR